MQIVIVGAGKLGYSIAESLSGEQHDVVLVDRDESRLEAAKNTLDVLTIMANGASPLTMNDPDVRGADILVAVTDSDEVNIVACILAKKNGIKHTAVRIRDMQFPTGAREYLKENFGIDLMLNPEMITALEINRILGVPAALNVEDFAGGKVRLFETKIGRDSGIANICLKDLTMPASVLVGMIYRDHRMIIPHGDDCFLYGDNVYFIGDPKAIEELCENFVQRDARKARHILIIGAGRIGRALAPMLLDQGLKVKVIEKDRERCRLIAEKMASGLVLCGDGTDIDLLQEEGINEADVVVCLTEDDKLNLLMALLAKHLGAKKTIVRVARNEYVDLMEKVGVDIVLSSRSLSARRVLTFARSGGQSFADGDEEAARQGGVVSVSVLEGAKAEAMEIILPKASAVCGKMLRNVLLPHECLVCAYVRDNEARVANGSTVLLPGDRVILFVHTGYTERVMTYFKGGD